MTNLGYVSFPWDHVLMFFKSILVCVACFLSLVLSLLVPSRLELLISIHIRITCCFCIVFTRNMHFLPSCCICGFRLLYEFCAKVFLRKLLLFPHMILHFIIVTFQLFLLYVHSSYFSYVIIFSLRESWHEINDQTL